YSLLVGHALAGLTRECLHPTIHGGSPFGCKFQCRCEPSPPPTAVQGSGGMGGYHRGVDVRPQASQNGLRVNSRKDSALIILDSSSIHEKFIKCDLVPSRCK